MPTEVLINNDGQTEERYETCGDECTVLVMTWLGAPFEDADPTGSVNLGDGVTLNCAGLGEGEGDAFCAGCGDFLRHGMSCECPPEDGIKKDPEPLGRPHIDFRNNA